MTAASRSVRPASPSTRSRAQRRSASRSTRPVTDLSDFNDFFDAGDMFGGEGTVRAGVDVAGGAVVATKRQRWIARREPARLGFRRDRRDVARERRSHRDDAGDARTVRARLRGGHDRTLRRRRRRRARARSRPVAMERGHRHGHPRHGLGRCRSRRPPAVIRISTQRSTPRSRTRASDASRSID